MSVAKVTRKGQITIPKDIRDSLGISDEDHVVIVVDGNTAILRAVPRSRLSELKGRLPASRPYPGHDAIREETGRGIGERHSR
ncbi:MAG: AbrB/MazE/SpoVT family DNA-binding domain-containing protein [Armatimonadetes bacterium]|nr:AbrB/MazE/SpoVT family DNA-binding domain-containing protein [Armatimonadota bacterium]